MLELTLFWYKRGVFMYLVDNLEEQVINIPYIKGYRDLRVLSGYVSPLFVEHVIQTYKDLKLEVILGMTSKDGLAIWHHLMFIELSNKYQSRLKVHYNIDRTGNHRKVYHWKQKDLILEDKIFLGSANFTHSGFEKLNEVLVEHNSPNFNDLFNNISLIDCKDSNVENLINLFDENNIEPIISKFSNGSKLNFSTRNSVSAKFVNDQGVLPSKSGLNWGQRPGRNPNQAYIPIKKSVHDTMPYFFPEAARPFLIYTDDHKVMRCVMAQDFRKAIQTTENNAILGLYFRKRLGVPDGSLVTIDHLLDYGRDDVTIIKIDEETYYLDFSI